MSLVQLPQEDFAAGAVPAVARHLIPENGFYEGLNALTDDDGSIYRRGGSEYKSSNGLGALGLKFVWDGYLTPGLRTVVGAIGGNLAVLGGDDATLTQFSTLDVAGRAAESNGLLFLPGGAIYGGSRKTADYSTGTVTVTNGSTTVTGSGTAWLANVDAGMLFHVGTERSYVVASVISDTQLTLRDAYQGTTGGGKTYNLLRTRTGGPYTAASEYAVAGDRVWAFIGNKAYFSNPDDPHTWGATSFHELPGGVEILGGERIRDQLMVFTTNGIWLLSGIALDLTDDFGNVQHKLEHVSQDLVLWNSAGIATWAGSLVVPCTDGIYLLDGISSPEKLTRSVAPKYVGYVQAGHRVGQAAVYRNHYFLPVVSQAFSVEDNMVCRLDRPSGSRIGTIYPWSYMRDSGGTVTAYAVRVPTGSRTIDLFGTSGKAASRLLKLSGFFDPNAARKNDADGTTHLFRLVTRNFPTGNGNKNMVRKLQVRYELIDAASDNPRLSGAYADGQLDFAGTALWDVAIWDTDLWAPDDAGEWTAMAGTAPEDDGRTPYRWVVGKRARYLRFKIECSQPCAKLVIRAVELRIRPSGKP